LKQFFVSFCKSLARFAGQVRVVAAQNGSTLVAVSIVTATCLLKVKFSS